MKRLILLLIALITLTSCEPVQVRQGRIVYKAYFNYILKDPSSLVIYSEKYTLGDNKHDVSWKIDYGAKNGYGGMTRDYIEFTTSGNFCIKIDPLYGGQFYSIRELNGY